MTARHDGKPEPVRYAAPMGPRKRPIRPKKPRAFDAVAYLESTDPARKVVKYRQGGVVFAQGDPANGVRYLQKGAVKVSVVSRLGKEAVVALLSRGDFFGEGALAGQSVRIETATALAASSVLVIEKNAMARLLHRERCSQIASSLTC